MLRPASTRASHELNTIIIFIIIARSDDDDDGELNKSVEFFTRRPLYNFMECNAK